MKIRCGFVSNSSSSSFVVLLPHNLNVRKGLQDAFNRLVNEGELWEEECFGYFGELVDILNDYIIAVIETPSDGGVITIADREKVEKIIGDKK
jgi:hypothetical protein